MADTDSEQVAAPEGDEASEEMSDGFGNEGVPSFDIQIPPELLAELEEEDEDDSEGDLAALAAQFGEDNDEELLKRLAKAEKRASYLESLRSKEASKNWSDEAKKFFPLSEPFLGDINATSRRAFLRTAKQLHDKVQPLVEEKFIKPTLAAREAAKAAGLAEAKGEAKDAWGTPVEKDTSSEVPEVVNNQQQRRRRTEFSDSIRAMMFPKE